MPFARKAFRGNKVWAEVDEQGRLVVRSGLVRIRYRQDDERDYSARVDQVSELPPAPPEPPADPAMPTAPAAVPRPRKKRAPRAAPPRAPSAAAGDVIVAYTDGACFGNPGPAGIGVLLEWKGRRKELARYLGEGTNNIAELTAIEAALQEVKQRSLPVRVHTDSAYSIGVLSEGWRVKENRELVARIQRLMLEFADLRFVKVRGHSGDELNERVDQLARDAIARRA
jgi:ribonuclease HI